MLTGPFTRSPRGGKGARPSVEQDYVATARCVAQRALHWYNGNSSHTGDCNDDAY